MAHSLKTSKKTPKKFFNGAKDGKPFSPTNQPTSEQKKRGWAKKKALKDLLDIATPSKFGRAKTDYRKIAANYFGIKEENVTIKMVMEFKQIQKAITKSDTYAFSVLMDRAFGKPVQAITGEGGKDLIPQSIAFISAESLSSEQIEKLINNGSGNNNESL